MEKSNHELAIEWWLKLNRDDKHEFAKKFYQTYWIDELTGNEIEEIWLTVVVNEELVSEEKEAILYLQKKLYGLHSTLQQAIFESISRIENGNDIQRVLDWYHKIEEVYNNF
jgi:hypothetical protein